MTDDALSRVVIAISTYKSDESVLALLEQVFSDGGRDAAAIIVVDSENHGDLRSELTARGWAVQYENAGVNLGSAGNLARRLELAAEVDADWCFAINHDGMFAREMVERLVQYGQAAERVGAVYPRRVLIDRGNTILSPHTGLFDLPSFRAAGQEPHASIEVAWDSSNGALYALAPVRKGVRVWSDLWMGWEDLAYGWQLADAGWKQIYGAGAEFQDDYEYQKVRFIGTTQYITRKPGWYGYYVIRNLIIILRRTRAGAKGWAFLMVRLVRESAFALLFRDAKMVRLRFIAWGLIDGLRGVTGRGRGR